MDNRMPQDEGLSMAELQGPEAPKLGKDGRYPLDLYRIYIGINRISEDLFRIYLGINRIGIYRMDLIEFNRILLMVIL